MTDKYTIDDVEGIIYSGLEVFKLFNIDEYEFVRVENCLFKMNQAYEEGRNIPFSAELSCGFYKELTDLRETNEVIRKQKETLLHNVNHYADECIKLQNEIKILEDLSDRRLKKMQDCEDFAAISAGEQRKLREENEKLKEENNKIKDLIEQLTNINEQDSLEGENILLMALGENQQTIIELDEQVKQLCQRDDAIRALLNTGDTYDICTEIIEKVKKLQAQDSQAQE